MRRLTILVPVVLLLCACGDLTRLPPRADVGAEPRLLEPAITLIPTVNIAPARGWGVAPAKPIAAPGLFVSALASDLHHPRWVYVLPNGDVLVAETNRPPQPEARGFGGIKRWIMGKVQARAGAGVPSADRITLLRDADGDGIAESRWVFASGLLSPFGMALVDESLYVANADGVVKFAYAPGATRVAGEGERIVELPAGINHHWTKNIIASRDGTRLYATVGSNSNIAENGMAAEEGRAAIWEIDLQTRQKRLFATGLRNPNGMAWEPTTGALWTVVNERDELGSDLVPDYLTSVKASGFYGWPYSYFGAHVDPRPTPPRPDLVATAIKPDYALGSHVAPLGLVSAEGATLPAPYVNGMFVGLHGSWNRRPKSGYQVVFVPFNDGLPNGLPIDVLSGFLSETEEAYGRPVGVAIDKRGALLVADDVGNTVWRVVAAPAR